MKNVTEWVTESLVGGRSCLDFVNTVGWRAGESAEERLHTYDDLVEWGRGAGLVAERDAVELRRHAQRDPEAARAALEQALQLREALYRLFTRLRERRSPEPADLEILEEVLAAAPPRQRLAWRHGAYDWDLGGAAGGLERVLWPVVWSAADLLVEGEAERIKECAGHRCGWLFFDSSRNRSRRWCSMRDCGNRAKVRRHYQRTHRQKEARSRASDAPEAAAKRSRGRRK